jgi:hypothetical protein
MIFHVYIGIIDGALASASPCLYRVDAEWLFHFWRSTWVLNKRLLIVNTQELRADN